MTIVGPVGTGSGRAAVATPGASGRSAAAPDGADRAAAGCVVCPAAAVADCPAAGCAVCARAGKPAIAKTATANGSAKRVLRRVMPLCVIPIYATEHRLTQKRQQRQPSTQQPQKRRVPHPSAWTNDGQLGSTAEGAGGYRLSCPLDQRRSEQGFPPCESFPPSRRHSGAARISVLASALAVVCSSPLFVLCCHPERSNSRSLRAA